LVETSDGLVLVDSGFGLDDVSDPIKRIGRGMIVAGSPACDPAETAARQVEALGYKRDDVRHIVVTHLDLDHAGGIPDFPKAKVHVHAPEHAAAMKRASFLERERYHPQQWAHHPDWVLHEVDGERWMGFDAVQAIDRETNVLIVPLIGHSRGHAGIAVKDGDRWLFHAGDAYFFRDETDPNHPFCPPGLKVFQSIVEMDRTNRLNNQRRLRELRRLHGDEVTVFCAHDPVELANFS
jgi:glyoxylase-like metal-dependent hydrolase (beta-lactamase superfamily II)